MLAAETAILCVDDEAPILQVLKEQLNRLFGDQFIYEIAQSAEEAQLVIADLEAEGIKTVLIVSDWLMPNVRGDEFLIDLHGKYPSMVKIMMTGQADEQSVEHVRQKVNLFACIYKPWQESELYQVLSSALDL